MQLGSAEITLVNGIVVQCSMAMPFFVDYNWAYQPTFIIKFISALLSTMFFYDMSVWYVYGIVCVSNQDMSKRHWTTSRILTPIQTHLGKL